MRKQSRVARAKAGLHEAISAYGTARDRAAFTDGYRSQQKHDEDLYQRSLHQWRIVGERQEALFKAVEAFARAVKKSVVAPNAVK